jgi:hypothetical protein
LWMLSSGQEVWIMDLLDDHSRLVPAALAVPGPTAQAAWDTFCVGAERFGLPAHVMSDNGPCFTARFRGGEAAFEGDLRALGIGHILSTPGHPQTCGKLERFHQTLKKWLAARPLARSRAELGTQLEEFLGHYNTARPHRALAERHPPRGLGGQPTGHPGCTHPHPSHRPPPLSRHPWADLARSIRHPDRDPASRPSSAGLGPWPQRLDLRGRKAGPPSPPRPHPPLPTQRKAKRTPTQGHRTMPVASNHCQRSPETSVSDVPRHHNDR